MRVRYYFSSPEQKSHRGSEVVQVSQAGVFLKTSSVSHIKVQNWPGKGEEK